MRSFLAILLLTVALSGCLSGSNGDDDTMTDPNEWASWHTEAIFGKDVDPAEFDFIDSSEPHRALHDHNNRSHHVGLSTPNFEVLGWSPMVGDHYGVTPGGHFCGGVSQTTDDGRQISVIHSISSEVAIMVMDVTDANNPFVIGELVLPLNSVYDATITSDGRYAIVSVGPSTSVGTYTGLVPGSEAESPSMVFRNACTGEETTHDTVETWGPGTLLVDLSDPEHPTPVDFHPGGALGPHSVDSRDIDGVEYIVASTTNLAYENSYYQIFTLSDALPTGAKLVLHTEYSAQYAQGRGQYWAENNPSCDPDINPNQPSTGCQNTGVLTQGHVEGTVFKHPVTGQILAGLSGWHTGMVVIDISVPGVPIPVSTWGSFDDSSISFSGAIHGMEVFGMRDDRFYVVAGQEVLSSVGGPDFGRPTGQIVMVDLTDPENPEAVARWTLPQQVFWNSGSNGQSLFSTHYFTFVDDLMFVTMYHGGVWAVDTSETHWPELPSLGAYIPDRFTEEPVASRFTDYTPISLDVFTTDDGNLLLYDADSGAYILSFDETVDVPVPEPWIQDAWIGV